MTDQGQQLDPAQLAEVVKEMSDEELAEQIKNLGTDEVLKGIFDGMQQAFNAQKAGTTEAVIQYDIETDEGVKSWSCAIANGACTTSEGASDNPRLTLKMQLVDFIRLIFGQADGTQLFMTGKMKLQGDMMFAMQMQGFFDAPA